MRAHTHGGPAPAKNAPHSRPDTLMQDRSTTCRTDIPLATRGRTIHPGHLPPFPWVYPAGATTAGLPSLTDSLRKRCCYGKKSAKKRPERTIDQAAFSSLLLPQERTIRGPRRGVCHVLIARGAIMATYNAASPYCGAARGLQPRRGPIAPAALHRQLAGVRKFPSASLEAWAGTAHRARHRSRRRGAECHSPYAAPANATPQCSSSRP